MADMSDSLPAIYAEQGREVPIELCEKPLGTDEGLGPAALAQIPGRYGVLNHLLADFLHRQPFELVRAGRVALDARQGAAPQLLRALRGNVHEQEAARDQRGWFCRRVLDCVCAVDVINHGA